MLQSEFTVRQLCGVLGVSKSAYYAYQSGESYELDSTKAEVSKAIEALFYAHKRRYGWRRIQKELAAQGIEVGRHQIRNRMKERNLVAIQPKSYVPKTTQSSIHLGRSDNLLLDKDNWPTAPNEVIVGDITYLPNHERGQKTWLYLATWLDLFSRRIVGWHLDRNMEASLIIQAFEQVIAQRQPSRGFIVHSDGGTQYASIAFRQLLKVNQYRQSMTRKDNHYDNAHAESLFSRFKAELLDGQVFSGFEDAKAQVFEYIEGYYNYIRRHSSLHYLSPDEFKRRFYSGELQ